MTSEKANYCSSDSEDSDVVLEEVTKIFRCKDCQRCYISSAKFAEHYPQYHPDVVQAVLGYPQSTDKQCTPLPSSLISPQTARDVVDKAFQEEKTLNADQIVAPAPKRKKISLQRKRRNIISTMTSHFQSQCPSDDLRESEQSEKSSTMNGTRFYIDADLVHDSIRKKSDADESEPVKQNSIIENIQPSQTASETGKHISKLKIQKGTPNVVEVRCNEPDNQVEVITLSDSDDDNYHTANSTFSSGTHLHQQVKQEVLEDLEQVKQAMSSNREAKKAATEAKNQEENYNLSFSSSPHKKYSCQFCYKLFTRESALESHLKTIHKNDLAEKERYEELQRKIFNHNGGNGSVDMNPENLANGKVMQLEQGYPFQASASDEKRRNSHSLESANVKKRKSKRKGPMLHVDPIPVLTFSCKWCPEKFKQLEELKRHAIFQHIKYKLMD